MTDTIQKWLSETLDQVYMHGSARSITTGFFIAGCLWILCSELILFFFFSAPPDYLMIETLKGLLFIAVASAVVYGLSRRKMRYVHARFISERLKDALNFQKILQENLGEAVFIVDPTTRTIRSCNDAVKQIFGYDRGELLDKSTLKLHVSEESFNEFLRISEADLQKNQVFRHRFDMKRKDGTVFATENTVIALAGADDWENGVVSIIRDISEQVNAQRALHKSEKRYRLLAENTLDLIWEMTPDMIFTYVNPAIFEIAGYTQDEFIGTALKEHMEQAEFEKVKQIIQNEFEKESDGSGITVTTSLLHKNQTPIPIENHGKILFGEQGRPISIQGTTRDITQRKILEDELRQSQKLQAIGTFAGGIAHEIKSPITGISGFAEIISSMVDEKSKIREHCAEIQQQIQRVHSLIQNLLGYAHTDEDETTFEKQEIKEVVESTVSLVRTLIRHDKIHLNVHIPNDLPPVSHSTPPPAPAAHPFVSVNPRSIALLQT